MSSSSPFQLYTTLRQTATDFINSYSQDNAGKDVTRLSATLAPDCRRYFAPNSLIAALPFLDGGRTNQQYEEQMAFELKTFKSWTLEIKSVTIDEHQRQTAVRSLHTCTMPDGTVYPFEFVFILDMIDDGSRVKKIVQFTDVAMGQKMMDEQKEIAEILNKQK